MSPHTSLLSCMLLLSSATLSAVFLPLPPSSCCSVIVSLHSAPLLSASPRPWADDYSNKKHLSLQITTVIQTPATAIVCCCGLSSWAVVLPLYLSSSSPFLSMSHMMTPPWPSATLSLVAWRPSRESCSTIVQSVLLCVDGGREVGLPATVILYMWR